MSQPQERVIEFQQLTDGQRRDYLASIIEESSTENFRQPTREEVELVLEFQQLIQQESEERLKAVFISNPQEYLRQLEGSPGIQNGNVVNVVIGAVFTAISGGIWLGVVALAAGLASAWLAPQQQQQQQQQQSRRPDPKFSNVFAGSLLNQLARVGDTIPAIFCSRSKDPTGGVQVAGAIVHNRIETKDGNQSANSLFVLSHGTIGNVDLTKTLINNQPLSNYSASAIQLDWKNGASNQTGFANFPYFCQNTEVRDNAGAGIGLVTSNTTRSQAVTVNNPGNFAAGGVYNAIIIVTTPPTPILNSSGNPTYGPSGNQLFNPAINTPTPFNITVTGISGSTLFYGVNVDMPLGTVIKSTAGVTLATTTASSTNSSSFLVPEEDFQSQSDGQTFLIRNGTVDITFKALSRNFYIINGVPQYYVETSMTIPWAGGTLYRYESAIFRTTKRVDRFDLNCSFSVWARNTNGEIIDFATIYSLRIKLAKDTAFIELCQMTVRSQNPGLLLRGLEVSNLPLYVYDIQIIPKITLDNPIAYELKDNGVFVSQGLTALVSGSLPSIRLQGERITAANYASWNNLASITKARTPDHSGEGGATLRIVNVNEIERPSATSKTRDCNYKNLAIASFKCEFNSQLQSGLTVTWFVDEGIITHQLLLAGTADSGSATGTLKYVAGFGMINTSGLVIRNVSNRTEQPVTGISGTTLTAPGLIINEGDNFILKKSHSTCWWPEIDSWLAYDSKFGISRQVCADYYIDWVSMVEATRWVEGVNEHNQKFAWHGILKATQSYPQISSENARQVLLQPWRGRGKKGFYPYKTPPLTAIYNESNADGFKRTRTAIDFQSATQLTVNYNEPETFVSLNPISTSDPTAFNYNQQSITVQSWKLWKNEVALIDKKIDLQNCTSRSQATMTAKILFNINRYAGRIASQLNAKTTESFSLGLGELYRTITAATQYQAERSGMVVEVIGNEFRLDRNFVLGSGLTTSAGVGVTDGTKDFILMGVSVGDTVWNVESKTKSIVSAVAQKTLTCTPLIPNDTYYEIYDKSSTGLVAYIYGSAMEAPVNNPTWRIDTTGNYWYNIGIIPNISDVVLIGRTQNYDRLFQSIAIEPSITEGEASVAVVGTNFTPKFFDYSDLVWSDRNTSYNEPPP